ncbi:hypothetical protein I4U23_017118 [Adineta vaga]|nr:hypothetical protein I4U23_017118 [Adineta vaga]
MGYLPYSKVEYEFLNGTIYKKDIDYSHVNTKLCTKLTEDEAELILNHAGKNNKQMDERKYSILEYLLGSAIIIGLFIVKYIIAIYVGRNWSKTTNFCKRLVMNLSRVMYAPCYFPFTIIDYKQDCIQLDVSFLMNFVLASYSSLNIILFCQLVFSGILLLIGYCCSKCFVKVQRTHTGQIVTEPVCSNCRCILTCIIIITILGIFVATFISYGIGFWGSTNSITVNSLMAVNLVIEFISMIREYKNNQIVPSNSVLINDQLENTNE